MTTTARIPPGAYSLGPAAVAIQTPLVRRSAFAFGVAVAVLLVAALGLNFATAAMKLHFRKLPVPLRQPLSAVSDKLGDWVCVIKTEVLGDDLEETLGTRTFIFRDYVNSRMVPQADIAKFDKKSLGEQRKLLAVLQARKPDSVINFAVTYYTGKADTVAHIPDRCYVANGFEPKEYITSKWNIPTPITMAQQVDPGKIEVRFINFEDQNGSNSVPTNVAYFFHTDGHYESDPTRVRLAMQNLRKRFAYYAKVEVQTLMPTPKTPVTDMDQDRRRIVMSNFLAAAMPEVEKCLPSVESLQDLKTSGK